MGASRKSGKRFGMLQKMGVLALAAALVLPPAACGDSSRDVGQAEEWLWVPEYISLDETEEAYHSMQLAGDTLYYLSDGSNDRDTGISQNICRFSPGDKSVDSVPVSWTEKSVYRSLKCIAVAQDGSVYGVADDYDMDAFEKIYYLCRFGANGRQLFAQEVTDLVGHGQADALALDGQGRIYLSCGGEVLLFDGEGNHKGKVSPEIGIGGILSMGCGKDGRMYVTYYKDKSGSCELAEIDFDGKKTGATYPDFPGSSVVPGIQRDFLVNNGSQVCEYDMKSWEQEELFSWMDSDIAGMYVQNFGVLDDGRILAVIMDWQIHENSIVLLTRTKTDEVPRKETVVLASLEGGSDLQDVVARFNKGNDRYRIELRDYRDSRIGGDRGYEAMWEDALNRLNMDIISDNCPDIIDLSGLNIEQMAVKGIFEDLNGYLEGSGRVSRSDFVEHVLDAYTFDGRLVSIPCTFGLQAVAARASDVGGGMNPKEWDLEELIAYADAHPDALLFDNASKSEIMQYLLTHTADVFIDWSAGECSFDSWEFKRLLQFVNRFPDSSEGDYAYLSDSYLSTPAKIQNGQVLLYDMKIDDFYQMQVAAEIFQGDVAMVGCPVMEGSRLGAQRCYAILSGARQKDGAWEFLERYLTQEADPERRLNNGFPTLKSRLEAMAEDSARVEYQTDEKGELVLDENGEPVVSVGGAVGGFAYADGWSYDYRRPTREEVDLVMDLIQIAKPPSYARGDEVLKIIREEAEAFYRGQKTVDEVASIIQNRAKIFVGENKQH